MLELKCNGGPFQIQFDQFKEAFVEVLDVVYNNLDEEIELVEEEKEIEGVEAEAEGQQQGLSIEVYEG